MEIWLRYAWYKHPFPKSRFTLHSAKQIALIRELKLDNVHYHSGSYRSAPEPDSEPDPCFDAPHLNGLESLPAEWVMSSDGQPSHPERSASIRRSELRQAHHAYRDTLRKSSDCLRQLGTGQGVGSHNASALVQHFINQIMQGATSMALTDVLHLNILERAQAAHGLNSCILSLLVGRELDLEPADLNVVGMAGLLHDIGEQRLPSQIRLKTEPLTRAEKSLFELHPLYGKEMLQGLRGMPCGVADIVAQHHECMNGTGYPRRLTDEQLHPLSKIIRVVDEYQYLTNPREAHLRLHPNQALAELYVKRQQQLSVKVIIALVRVVSVYPPGTLVELTDGSIGIVLYTSASARLRPVVMAYEERASELVTRLVDLDEERELCICRVVGPAELSPHLVERLTPAEALHCLLEQTSS